MVFHKCGLEGTGTLSIATVTSLPQHNPVPTPPETKCSRESRVETTQESKKKGGGRRRYG